MGRAVTFKGANDLPDCSGMVRFGASINVKMKHPITGTPTGVSRQFDFNTPHRALALKCGFHAAAITTGSLKVKVNGRGCGRMFDSVGPGCTFVAQGHPKVFAG
jgi:uncharacterized Zn-binding protein involved in type VI secretion|tara:strand:- start:154 stop:465 length:312 start_codon:yes stop_codon:yes gene_type:complete